MTIESYEKIIIDIEKLCGEITRCRADGLKKELEEAQIKLKNLYAKHKIRLLNYPLLLKWIESCLPNSQ
ncbi:YidC/Oxa1 family membrane protein insertase [Priestia megaterium]|uniref:YidC/Oxa1 family membrane protein insertase n=1 Tax=Priestia megaterium TaxID=1404 RepID=UPI0021F4BF60|nr:YidC/Oxa1 family membrane protein insertase [Priestia megaterium]UYP07264.1 YidC/Oxa1 family membrane protein insertase [Priestia megaterium]